MLLYRILSKQYENSLKDIFFEQMSQTYSVPSTFTGQNFFSKKNLIIQNAISLLFYCFSNTK